MKAKVNKRLHFCFQSVTNMEGPNNNPPAFLKNLVSDMNSELTKCKIETDIETQDNKRLDIHRQALKTLSENLKTFGPVLSLILEEYDDYIRTQQRKQLCAEKAKEV